MLLEKGQITDLLPCAGITLIRFYGYDLRSVLGLPVGFAQGQTPRETLSARPIYCPARILRTGSKIRIKKILTGL